MQQSTDSATAPAATDAPGIQSPTAQATGTAREAPRHQRLNFLDSIRGVAALAVLCQHYVQAYELPCWQWLLTYTPLHFWWDGAASVSMFFVLSGLVLSMGHYRATKTPTLEGYGYSAYVWKRFCRLMLPYGAFLLFSALMVPLLATQLATNPPLQDWARLWWRMPLNAHTLLRQFVWADMVKLSLIPPAWTLRIELLLSLLIPFAVLIVNRSSLWLIGAIALGMVGFDMPCFPLHFLMGILIARYYREIEVHFAGHRWLRLSILTCGLLLYTARFTFPHYLGLDHWLEHRDTQNPIRIVTGVGAALLLIYIIGSAWVRNFLGHSLMRFLGRISYSVFLVHMAVLMCVTPRVIYWLNQHGAPYPWLLGLLATIVLSIFLAVASYWILEVPSIALGKRLGPSIPRPQLIFERWRPHFHNFLMLPGYTTPADAGRKVNNTTSGGTRNRNGLEYPTPVETNNGLPATPPATPPAFPPASPTDRSPSRPDRPA